MAIKPTVTSTRKSTVKSAPKKIAAKTAVVKKRVSPKKGLGKGLENLLGKDADVLSDLTKKVSERVQVVPLTVLQAGKYQPRNHIDEASLTELSDSIKEQGLMQPILVRPLNGDRYEIIAGERRFRAAKLAGLSEVPVLVKEVGDQKAAIMALIENMQREDLTALEEAKGIRRLLDEFNFTHEQAARAVGRSRSFTSNLLRLLNLAQPVQIMLSAGDIDMGHARALLALENAQQIIAANQIHAKRLSVRETEKLVKKILEGDVTPPHARTNPAVNRDLVRLQENLSDYLATKVGFKMGKKGRGQLIIDFNDWEHLNALLEKQGLSGVFDSE